MKSWKATHQTWEMNYDRMPKGKEKRVVNKLVRAKLKVELLKEVKDVR